MGNAQGQQKHGGFSSGNKISAVEDSHPFVVTVTAKSTPNSSTHSLQYMNTNEFPVVLKWNTPAKAVTVSGSWDGWKRKIPLVKSKEDFTTIINLPEGCHEFKFCVDSNWVCDSDLSKCVNSSTGADNNCIEVNRNDFDVSDALDRDLQETMTKSENADYHFTSSIPNKLEKFGHEVPGDETFDKSHRPPVLPPHLLHVILNQDTPVTCDPNVLPEPNHVMLNHLYALSIKDGVMVLSTTRRYHKKYVTTLLYKPI